MKVGFIGLGLMGSGMAGNLLKAGMDLTVYDIRSEAAQSFVDGGARRADSVAQLGREVDVVFSSLPTPKDMQAVAVELLATLKPGSAWFDLTTNSPTVVREVAGQARARGIAVLDAPVSGGPGGARTRKLAIYLGGDRAVFDRHQALLDAIGDRVMYCGEVGTGSIAKIVHNLISFAIRRPIAEAVTLGVKAGMDPVELWHAVRQGAVGRSRTLDTMGEQYLESRFDPPSFALKLAYKDLMLAMDLAREYDVPMKASEAAIEDYTAAMERGWGDRDSRSPMLLQNERAGVTIQASAEDVQKMLARG